MEAELQVQDIQIPKEQVAVEVVTVLEKMGDWVDVVKSESIAGEESWVDTH